MADDVSTALFVYSPEGESYLQQLRDFRVTATIHGIRFDELVKDPGKYLETISRVIVAADLGAIKKILQFGEQYGFSIGFVPLPQQKTLAMIGDIPTNLDESFALALSNQTNEFHLFYCNDRIILFQATLGDIPLLANPDNIGWRKVLGDGLQRLKTLQLKPISITTGGDNPRSLSTAACGCMILHNPWSVASRLIAHDNKTTDGMISMLVSAPLSITDYLNFLWRVFSHKPHKSLPLSIGYIKSPEITIGQAKRFTLSIDGELVENNNDTLVFKASSSQVRICNNRPSEDETAQAKVKERFDTASLPRGKEIDKAVRKKRIPFFPYASEDRFKELFISLREDAQIDSKYMVLMLLSTLIATFGLYLDSASVIIGAMLLAPLMAPIISAAMGVLRGDHTMLKNSILKILLGITLAVSTAALITFIMPYTPTTGEMQSRLHPTVLDLAVAVVAGIAGAYTKSFKEILQSLAGVAIAVALVPPLATAGIGLGQYDFSFFIHAFLLFSTNLAGILVAAVMTFRWLGFSSAVQAKSRFAVALCFLFVITIPLFLSYMQIIEQSRIERGWQEERFFVNGKYLIIERGYFTNEQNSRVLHLELLVRDQLTRSDLSELKRKIKANFGDDIVLRTRLTFIP